MGALRRGGSLRHRVAEDCRRLPNGPCSPPPPRTPDREAKGMHPQPRECSGEREKRVRQTEVDSLICLPRCLGQSLEGFYQSSKTSINLPHFLMLAEPFSQAGPVFPPLRFPFLPLPQPAQNSPHHHPAHSKSLSRVHIYLFNLGKSTSKTVHKINFFSS